MRRFRLLKADEIECRIARCFNDSVQLLLYKTARTDSALLDEKYPDSWQCDFKALDGKMYGGIGIKLNGEWLWRWDCGSESNMEAEKGEASDAFKRAGFKWGIGTELYSSPQIFIPADKCKITNGKCTDRFRVMNIGYDDNERIIELDIDNVSRHCSAFHYVEKGKSSSAIPVPEMDRDLTIKTIVVMAVNRGLADVVNAQGYKGQAWDEIPDDQLRELKLFLMKQ